jgi:hypothetical protein
VPVEAKKYIPIPLDALARDFQVAQMTPDVAGKARLGVLIAVTQNKNLANITGVLHNLGLNLIGLEVAPCSVMRLWQGIGPQQGTEAFVQVHFDGGNVRIMICDRGLPVFFREVFLGVEVALSDQRKIDMSGCLSFAQKQLGLNSVSKILLSGTPTALASWRDVLAQETGVKAEIQDTAKLLSIKGGDWGGYAAIGASVRSAVPSTVTIDLLGMERISEDERQVARDIIVMGMAAAALIALFGIFHAQSYNRRARELKAYKVGPDVTLALQGLAPMQIDLKLNEMKEQLKRLKQVTSVQRPIVSTILREIIELMPENMWLTRITVNNPLTGDNAGLDITLRGRTRGALPSDEQALAIGFKETLLRDPKLGVLFDVQLSLQGRSADAQAHLQEGGLDPVALARRLEERTEFTLELRGKH